jgi:hypothetical protein
MVPLWGNERGESADDPGIRFFGEVARSPDVITNGRIVTLVPPISMATGVMALGWPLCAKSAWTKVPGVFAFGGEDDALGQQIREDRQVVMAFPEVHFIDSDPDRLG